MLHHLLPAVRLATLALILLHFSACNGDPDPVDCSLPTIALGDDALLAAGNEMTLSVSSSDANLQWSTGATSQSIIVNEPGTYWVLATRPGCSDMVSDTIVITEGYRIANVTTDMGTMYYWLYNRTPNHKAKFIELAGEQHYNQFTFNRVIPNFVIQGGCPDEPQFFTDSPYLLDAEFGDSLLHKYGALGMGRDNNPEKQSNACQFYVVNKPIGLPNMDGDYTIFGEIIDGTDVLDAISAVDTDGSDQPLTALPLNVSVEVVSDAQLVNDFGFTRPD